MTVDPIEDAVARLGGFHYERMDQRPTDREAVARLEKAIGHPFPREYAEFLLRYPLGPVAFGKRAGFTNPRGGAVRIPGLYGIRELEDTFRMYNDHLMPTHWLAVADNEACDFVCLELTGGDAGKVYFFEHELFDYDPRYEPTTEGILPNEGSYVFLAPSFDRWLSMLEPLED
jgi:hypothetical protein